MMLEWIILLSFHIVTKCEEQLTILSRTHSARLAKYIGYSDSIIFHFKVPTDTYFVSFVFQAEEVALSLFHCKPKDVSVYLKHGSMPVINPDGAKFPDGFFNLSRPEIYELELKSDEKKNYINITSPVTGPYLAAAFKSYTDPKLAGITQEGLTPDCLTFLSVMVWVKQKPPPYLVVPDKPLHVLIQPNVHRLYKFFVPEIVDSALLIVQNINFCNNCKELSIKLQPNTIPQTNDSLYDMLLEKEIYNHKVFYLRFATLENSWYYVDFSFTDTNNSLANETGEFIFKVKYYLSFINVSSSIKSREGKMEVKTEVLTDSRMSDLYKMRNNNSVPYKHTILNDYDNQYLHNKFPYKQYNLVRDGYTESFTYSFDLRPNADSFTPLAVNLTNRELVVLKFHINQGLDIGGTLQFSLAFKPRIKTIGQHQILVEEPENHTVVACLKNGAKEIPAWPDKCVYISKNVAPIILNKTVDNSSIYIPFPEPGDWYITLRLFCNSCNECKCSIGCKTEYKMCSKKCDNSSENFQYDLCIDQCQKALLKKSGCYNCNCDGSCEQNNIFCKTSIMFAVASHPCVGGECGDNGKCVFLVAEGLAYSLCYCYHNYRGWDCSDGSEANGKGTIILELLLLVLSNLMFLPAVYISYKRNYYVEAIVYFSTCFFSIFYHACDAGENIYSFCLVRLSVLQFSDFFSGLLSIWVTVIAMAYLPNNWPSIFHIGGAILLAFGTTVDKTSLWVFALPFLTGILILIGSWYKRYKKIGKMFPNKCYLFIIFPSGLVVVCVGLLMYALLQTQSNYKYLHSLWHVLMAVAIIILLPNKKTFLPNVMVSVN